jgi:hypothetical protein
MIQYKIYIENLFTSCREQQDIVNTINEVTKFVEQEVKICIEYHTDCDLPVKFKHNIEFTDWGEHNVTYKLSGKIKYNKIIPLATLCSYDILYCIPTH